MIKDWYQIVKSGEVEKTVIDISKIQNKDYQRAALAVLTISQLECGTTGPLAFCYHCDLKCEHCLIAIKDFCPVSIARDESLLNAYDIYEKFYEQVPLEYR